MWRRGRARVVLLASLTVAGGACSAPSAAPLDTTALTGAPQETFAPQLDTTTTTLPPETTVTTRPPRDVASGTIAFTGRLHQQPGTDLYLLRTDGTAPIRLTTAGDLGAFVESPEWSPDGTTIAVAATFDGQRSPDLYVVDPTTGTATRLTDLGDDRIPARGPTWTPDGTALVFSSLRDGQAGGGDLYRLELEGSAITRLTDVAATALVTLEEITGTTLAPEDEADLYAIALDPDVSADGSRIVFSSNRDGQDEGTDLYILHLGDGRIDRLTTDGPEGANYTDPSWSEDGLSILVTRGPGIYRRPGRDILLVDVATGTTTMLTSLGADGATVLGPVWAGADVLLAADAAGQTGTDLYRVHLDGSAARLTAAGDETRVRLPGFVGGVPAAIVRTTAGERLTVFDTPGGRPLGPLFDRIASWVSGESGAVLEVDGAAHAELWWVSADGDPAALVPDVDAVAPALESDGGVIFAAALDAQPGADLYRVSAPGETPQRLTADGDNGAFHTSPAASPDGSLASVLVDGPAAYLVVDGTVVFSTRDGSRLGTPAWSPDGTRLAVGVFRPDDGHTVDVFVVPAAGGEAVGLWSPFEEASGSTAPPDPGDPAAAGRGYTGRPAWLDDTRVVFASNREGQIGLELYVADTATGDTTPFAAAPRDGDSIASVAAADGVIVGEWRRDHGGSDLVTVGAGGALTVVGAVAIAPARIEDPAFLPDGGTVSEAGAILFAATHPAPLPCRRLLLRGEFVGATIREEERNGAVPAQLLAPIGGGHALTPCAADAWNALQEEANAAGVPLQVTDSFRDRPTQEVLKELFGSGAARPGRSNHGFGDAVDFNAIGYGVEGVFEWVHARERAFGFLWPDWAPGAEPWHHEYRGTGVITLPDELES